MYLCSGSKLAFHLGPYGLSRGFFLATSGLRLVPDFIFAMLVEMREECEYGDGFTHLWHALLLLYLFWFVCFMILFYLLLSHLLLQYTCYWHEHFFTAVLVL